MQPPPWPKNQRKNNNKYKLSCMIQACQLAPMLQDRPTRASLCNGLGEPAEMPHNINDALYAFLVFFFSSARGCMRDLWLSWHSGFFFQPRMATGAPSHNSTIHFAVPSHAIPYHGCCCSRRNHTMSYHVIPYHPMPYHAIPCHTMPCHAIPYHVIPYHTKHARFVAILYSRFFWTATFQNLRPFLFNAGNVAHTDQGINDGEQAISCVRMHMRQRRLLHRGHVCTRCRHDDDNYDDNHHDHGHHHNCNHEDNHHDHKHHDHVDDHDHDHTRLRRMLPCIRLVKHTL